MTKIIKYYKIKRKVGFMLFKIVDKDNCKLDIDLQAELFPVEESPKQVYEGLKTGNPVNFIVYENDMPIGITGYYFDEKLPEHVFINWFGVLSEYRRKGYGYQIIEWLIKECKKLPVKYLTTYTDKIVNAASVRLYKRLGFSVRDYDNQEDINKFTNLGVENNYVACCLKLKDCEDIEFQKFYLKISDDLLDMEE